MPTTSNGTPRPGERRLSQIAKHLSIPSGIVAHSYPRIAARCRKMGVVHDDWQRSLGTHIFAKRENGLYAAGVGGVVLSTCRQVGKTFGIGTMLFALCSLEPGVTALWTSHHSKTTNETFEALSGLARRPQIAPYIRSVSRGNGNQVITFTNGSRILFGAREHGFGRGIPGVSIIIFDEAQILKESALNDMVPAANTVRNPLVILMGTPPDPKDPSEVFKARRRKALQIERQRADGKTVTSNLLYIELGADDGARPDDRKQWSKGNPSYPQRTPAESMMRLREMLGSDESFLREGLGVWDREQDGTRLITDAEWSATATPHVTSDGVRAIGVAFNQDGTRAALAGGLKHADGIHVELISTVALAEGGTGPLADWMAQRKGETATFVLAGRAGASALKQELRERGVPERQIQVVTTTEYTAAAVGLHDAVRGRTMTHPAAQRGDVLDASCAVSDKETRASGAWGWKATTPDGDETPMEAISLAHWGARTTKRRPGRKQKAVTM